MMTQTRHFPKPRTIAAIRELVAINIASSDSLTQASGKISDSRLRSAFTELALERRRQAADLNQLIFPEGDGSRFTSSSPSRVHRAIMACIDKLDDGLVAVLAEVVRGEVYIRSKYECALSHIGQEKVLDVLRRHYGAVKKSYHRIHSLFSDFSAQ
mgnify:FL=1